MATDFGPSFHRKPRSDAAMNKARLIAAARRILAEQPQASMASIAAEAGLGRNTIHRHFPSRHDLIEAVRRQATDDAEGQADALRPPGELANIVPTPLSVSDILNKVPPFQLGVQIVAEAQRLTGVSLAAIYLVDLDGKELRRLAGAASFPERMPVVRAIGPEIPVEGIGELRAMIEERLPGSAVAPLYMRGRASGVLIAIGTGEDNLRELAREAAVALGFAERYTDINARVRRAKRTSPAAEIQQNLLPPRVVRIAGAMLAGNVLPGYEIGGDWFDYTENPEGAWLGITDAEGTGPRAAATTSVMLGAFRSARRLDDATPASAVRLMHQTMLELSDTPRAVSTTVATWNGASAMLQWITCGQLPPVLIQATGELQPMGELQPPLGAPEFPERLRIQSRRLRRGERVLFASDGLLDRRSSAGELFGMPGIERAVAMAPSPSAADTLRSIEDAARAFSDDELRDDATLMVLAPSDGHLL